MGFTDASSFLINISGSYRYWKPWTPQSSREHRWICYSKALYS